MKYKFSINYHKWTLPAKRLVKYDESYIFFTMKHSHAIQKYFFSVIFFLKYITDVKTQKKKFCTDLDSNITKSFISVNFSINFRQNFDRCV